MTPTTRYFDEQVLRKRHYLTVDLCRAVIADPSRKLVQADGRIRHWGAVTLPGESEERILRVIAGRWRNPAQRLPRSRLPRVRPMKLHYYPETDSLYIELRATASTETREVAEGLNADFDAAGNVVGLDIDGASQKLDLATLETIALPIGSLKAA